MECIVEVSVESVLVTVDRDQWRVERAGVRNTHSLDIKSCCLLAPWGGRVAEKGVKDACSEWKKQQTQVY
jgi:hypothetical protein